MRGRTLRRLRRVPTRAPTPPGPQILWALRDTRSAPVRSRSKARRPAICVASQWNRAPSACTRSAISATGFNTPVSLLAAITDTSRTSGPIILSRSDGSTNPPPVTGMTSTFAKPWSSSHPVVRRTDACSTADTRTLGRSVSPPSTTPRNARLFASVAPAVNTTFPGRPPTSAATCSRASSTAADWRRPKRCKEEALPTPSARIGNISSSTRGSRGADPL